MDNDWKTPKGALGWLLCATGYGPSNISGVANVRNVGEAFELLQKIIDSDFGWLTLIPKGQLDTIWDAMRMHMSAFEQLDKINLVQAVIAEIREREGKC